MLNEKLLANARFVAAIAVILAISPTQGSAQTRLDRLESLSEEFTAVVYEKMVEELAPDPTEREAIAAAMPDAAWDDDFREAGGCILEAYETASSAEAVDQMLSDMEDALPRLADASMQEMEELGFFLPAGLSENDSLRINQECGMMELQRQRMMQSGFMEAMMDAARDG